MAPPRQINRACYIARRRRPNRPINPDPTRITSAGIPNREYPPRQQQKTPAPKVHRSSLTITAFPVWSKAIRYPPNHIHPTDTQLQLGALSEFPTREVGP